MGSPENLPPNVISDHPHAQYGDYGQYLKLYLHFNYFVL